MFQLYFLSILPQFLFVVAIISIEVNAAPTDSAVAHAESKQASADLETAANHPSVYGGFRGLGYGDFGGYGHGGYGGYGGYNHAGYNHGGYGKRYGNSYDHSGYTSINKVISHGSHGHVGGYEDGAYENGAYGAGSYGNGYYKK